MHIGGWVTDDEISHHASVIDKLCFSGNRNIVQVFSQACTNEKSPVYYIDMELCTSTLAEYIGNVGFWQGQRSQSPKEKLFGTFEIMRQLAEAVRFIHSCGEVHRDLNPTNGEVSHIVLSLIYSVLYRDRDQSWVVTGFSIVSELDQYSSGRSTPNARGTSGYRGPELLNVARFSSKVDIWALGCIMFELWTGRRVFDNDFSVFMWIQNSSTPPLVPMDGLEDDLHTQLQLVLEQLLKIDPMERPTADSLVNQFENFLRPHQTPLSMASKFPL